MKTSTHFLVTVIIPTYNRSTLLGHTLHSLTRQTLDRDRIQVIVVDDGSSDDTRRTVEGYRDALPLQYFFQEDCGNRTGRARNTGIGHAESDLCIFIDSGMLLHSRCLEAHLASYRAEKNAAVIGYAFGFEEFNAYDTPLTQRVDTCDPDRTIDYFRTIDTFNDLRDPYYRKYNDRLEDLPAPWVFFWTCNVSVPTRLLNRAGGFDENFDQTWGFEDIELAYRLFVGGTKIMLNREAVAIHYPHGKEDSAFKEYSQTRNKHYFHHKHNSVQSRLYLEASCLTFNDQLLGAPVREAVTAL